VGFKLTKPALYRTVFSQGWDQFIPFLVTVLAVVFTDLLTGVVAGLAWGLFFVIRTNHHVAITVVSQDLNYWFRFSRDASFVNKNEFRRKLRELPIDARGDRRLAGFFHRPRHHGDCGGLPATGPYKNIQIGVKHGRPTGRQQENRESHKQLLLANKAWVAGEAERSGPISSRGRRHKAPRSCGCYDSRVPAEVITGSEPG